MSENKPHFEIKHLPIDLNKSNGYKGHLEGHLENQPFIYGSNDEDSSHFKYDIPIFPIKEKK